MRLNLLPAVLLCSLLSLPGPAASQEITRNMPVPVLDLGRYAGQWYQVAHLPFFFQRKCVSDTTARYTLQEDGNIEVLNACTTAKGKRMEALGVAEPVPGNPGSLRVTFAPKWTTWLPMTWAPYWVLAVDPDYQWAVVGGPDRDHLWILAREPEMDAQLYARLVEQLGALGYPVDELVREAHTLGSP
ncbi:lipocalin family protein [Pseudoxanthomonas sp. J35]|uniref:lipocalin family protein n=1 Tax=Pseudoxanthomonas sp. J35 TaxID=935852 RepID=UPI0004904126|nr:lipocalin family protein [Pseudoxanthomonas sp. J35]